MAELPMKALLARAHAAHTARRAAMLSWVTPDMAVLTMAVLTMAVLAMAVPNMAQLTMAQLWLSLLAITCQAAPLLKLDDGKRPAAAAEGTNTRASPARVTAAPSRPGVASLLAVGFVSAAKRGPTGPAGPAGTAGTAVAAATPPAKTVATPAAKATSMARAANLAVIPMVKAAGGPRGQGDPLTRAAAASAG
eukprot:scaffold42505_cov57-Phaeocystis_antarctica.AAC.3